jgi:hypothetical protein
MKPPKRGEHGTVVVPNAPEPKKMARPPDPPSARRGTQSFFPVTGTSSASTLCPDLLRLETIGEADAWRGKLVRAFFRVLKVVTGV